MRNKIDLRKAFGGAATRKAGRPEGADDASGAGNGADGADGEDKGNEGAEDEEDEGSSGESDQGDAGGEEDVRNPELKRLHAESAKHRVEAKNQKARADAAEAGLSAAKVENAFLHAALGRVNDTNAAFKLAELKDVKLDVDGTPIGLDDVVTELLAKYPYLELHESSDEDDGADDDGLFSGGEVPPTMPSGRMTNGRRKTGEDAVTRQILEKKFPALKGRT